MLTETGLERGGVGFGFVPRLEIVGCFWSVNSC